jgi:hypothetical protein
MILRNWAKGMALNIDGNFFVVTQVYLLWAHPMMFHSCLMLHARPISEQLLLSFAIFCNIVIHQSYLKTWSSYELCTWSMLNDFVIYICTFSSEISIFIQTLN